MSTEQKPETPEQIAKRICNDRILLNHEAFERSIATALAAKDITVLTVHYESIIAAKDAEIEQLKASADGVMANTPQCGACAESLFCGSTMYAHESDCVYTQIEAKDAQIERLRAEAHSTNCPVSNERDELQEQLKAQTALLVEACRLIELEVDLCGKAGYPPPPGFKTFLSRPEVAALLAGKENSVTNSPERESSPE